MLGLRAILVAGALCFVPVLEPCAMAAPAQPASNATATVVIAQPVQVMKVTDMDFGNLTVNAAGTAVINPTTDSLTTTGGVAPISGTVSAGHFRITATRLALVLIHLPATAITLKRSNGPETMPLGNWTMDGFPLRVITNQGALDFAVGGTLTVANNQAEGTYVGTFDVTVDYF
jgi:hypothetical protein